MNFEKKDLLSFADLEILLSDNVKINVNDRADIIVKNLKQYCFFRYGCLHIFDSTHIVYNKIDDKSDDHLKTTITLFLGQSIKNITDEQAGYLQKVYSKKINSLNDNTFVMRCLPQIKTGLKQDTDLFNGDFYQIHFTNGYLDLKTLEFKQRVKNIHWVKAYIKRDYVKSTKEQRDKLLIKIKKIYPKKEDLNAILYILGSAITGKAIKEQKILFLLGEGSAGKSKIMELCQASLSCYFETLSDEAFSMSNSNSDKTFSTFFDRLNIRMIWINEPKEDRMNAVKFKMFCEGQMKGKLLFKDGEHDFSHNGLPIFTANTMPNITVDSGVKRRFRGYEHKSEFTSDLTKVNEKKYIYLKDKDLIENIHDEKLLDSWVDILAKYSNKWINGDDIPFPESFKQATDEMLEVNDKFKDFIDSKLSITTEKGDVDRIGKNDMMILYKELYPKSFLTPQQLIASLKSKGLEYKKDLRNPADSIQGCFINVQIKDFIPESNTNLDYNFGLNELKQQLVDKDLQIKELTDKLNAINQVVPVVTTAITDPDFNNSYLHNKKKIHKSKLFIKDLSLEDNLAQLEKELESFF